MMRMRRWGPRWTAPCLPTKPQHPQGRGLPQNLVSSPSRQHHRRSNSRPPGHVTSPSGTCDVLSDPRAPPRLCSVEGRSLLEFCSLQLFLANTTQDSRYLVLTADNHYARPGPHCGKTVHLSRQPHESGYRDTGAMALMSAAACSEPQAWAGTCQMCCRALPAQETVPMAGCTSLPTPRQAMLMSEFPAVLCRGCSCF